MIYLLKNFLKISIVIFLCSCSGDKPYGLKQNDGLTLTLFGYAIADLNGAQLQNKGLEIAKLTGHSPFDIGRAIGILKQGNLVRS
ncbi:MAG TPA: hypothetical protein EYG21_04485 [Nitrospinaceae bacterium]|jgi:hypothetical protein|nr:hypothetical protein [Nitrospinaceae bacterium]